MARIFISHSAANNAAALALGSWLSAEGWSDHFLDIDPQRGLVAGERWQEALKRAADRCEVIVFLISDAWVASTWCRAEFTLAQLLGKRIFGVLIEPIPLDSVPREMSAEWQLCDLAAGSERRHFDVRREPTVAATSVSFGTAGLAQLKRGLQQAGLDPQSFAWPPPNDPGRSPYRGLKPLEAEDAAIFFGRESAVVRGLDELRGMRARGTERLLVVLGASGSGKSSYLRAGLWPRLVRDDRHFMPLVPIRPHTAVISGELGLIASLEKAFHQKRIIRTRAQLRAQLERPQGLASLLGELQAAAATTDTDPPTIVISIDQGEELLGTDGQEESRHLLELLGGVLSPPSGELATSKTARQLAVAIVAIRSDSYAQLQQRLELSRVQVRPFDLRALSVAEFRAVITGPAARATGAGYRLEIDPQLTERLLSQSEGADALPLLAFILERLFLECGSDGDLRLDEYESLGGLHGSVQAAIDHALAEPGRQPVIPTDPEKRIEALRAGFIPWLALIDPDTAQRKRRVAQWQDIPDSARPLLERLVEARLLVRDGETVEVAHEALLRQWPLLTLWLDERTERLQTLEAVKRAAAEWRRRQEDADWLIHLDTRLHLAERALDDPHFQRLLGEVGEKYMRECRAKDAALHRGRQRARRVVKLLLVTVCVLVTVAGVATLIQMRQVSEQASRVLVANARFALTEGHDARAVRLAILAARSGWFFSAAPDAVPTLSYVTSGARIRRTFSFRPAVKDPVGLEFGNERARFSADGTRIFVYGKDSARLWDLESGSPLGELLEYKGLVKTVALSPDGMKALIVPDGSDPARLWDLKRGTPFGPLMDHDTNKVQSAEYSRDGKYLLTAGGQTARVSDARTGALITELPHQSSVHYAEFSPDEQVILTAGGDGAVRFWDVDQHSFRSVILNTQKPGFVPSLDFAGFAPDGKRVLTVVANTDLQLWDASTGKQLNHDRLPLGFKFRDFGFSRDGTVAFAFGSDQVYPWPMSYGVSPPLQPAGRMRDATLLGDRHLVVIATKPDAQVWDWKSPVGPPIRHDAVVSSIFLNGRHSRVVTTGSGIATWWQLDVGEALGPATPMGTIFMPGVLSANGRLLLTQKTGGVPELWDTGTNSRLCSLARESSSSSSLARFMFSPDGRRFVTTFDAVAPGTDGIENGVQVWDVQGCKALSQLRGHASRIQFLGFSADSRSIVTTSDDMTARLWNADNGAQIGAPFKLGHGESTTFAEISPDGRRLLTVDWQAHLWDINTRSEIETPMLKAGRISSARFSPDGERVVTAGRDSHSAQMWDGHTGAPLRPTVRHDDDVILAKFSPDGQRIVTASADSTARVWDAASGAPLGSPVRHGGAVENLVFAPDGRRVATSDRNGETRVWDLETGLLLMPPIPGLFEASGMSQVMGFVEGREGVAIANYDEPTRIWSVRWTSQRTDVLMANACRSLLPGATRIDTADIEAAPILIGRAGEDVCNPPGAWARLRAWLRPQ